MTEPVFPNPSHIHAESGLLSIDTIDLKDNSLPIPKNTTTLKPWIGAVLQKHNGTLLNLQIVFCSDVYLHKMNVEYLDHDTYTDIITFPYDDPPIVHGDLFISVHRVAENATTFEVTFEEELHRVIIHGVLHLLGYGDKTEAEAAEMRTLEREALELLAALNG